MIFETCTSSDRSHRTMRLLRQACLLAAMGEPAYHRRRPRSRGQRARRVPSSSTSIWCTSRTPITATAIIRKCAGKCSGGSWTSPSTRSWPPWTSRRRKSSAGRPKPPWRSTIGGRRPRPSAAGTFSKRCDRANWRSRPCRLNQTATLNRQQWQTMLHWLPEDLWQAVQPKAALQNDVNGFPRAGAMALLDRGLHYFFIGINPEFGGPPLQTARGALVADARRAEAVRLAGLSLLGRLFVLRGEELAARAIRPPPTRVIARRGPARSSRPTRRRCARPTSGCLRAFASWRPRDTTIGGCCSR